MRSLITNKILKGIAVIILVSVVVSGLVMTGCFTNLPSAEDPSVGNPAPDFQLSDLDGKTVSLSDFQGKPVLINFWASWCRPCWAEMPYIQQVYEEWSDRGLVVLTINWGDPSSKIKEFMRDYELSFPVLLDTKRVVAEKYEVWSIPTTFFIDKNGIIQAKVIGAFTDKAAIDTKLGEIIP